MVELDIKEIATRFNAWRKENSYSVAELAKELGTTEGTLNASYFNGRSLLSVKMIANLIKLGINVNWLLFGEDETSGYIVNEPKIEYYGLADQNKQLRIENKKLKKKNKVLKTALDKLLLDD